MGSFEQGVLKGVGNITSFYAEKWKSPIMLAYHLPLVFMSPFGLVAYRKRRKAKNIVLSLHNKIRGQTETALTKKHVLPENDLRLGHLINLFKTLDGDQEFPPLGKMISTSRSTAAEERVYIISPEAAGWEWLDPREENLEKAITEAAEKSAYFELRIRVAENKSKIDMTLTFKAINLNWELMQVSLLNPDRNPSIDSLQISFGSGSFKTKDANLHAMLLVYEQKWNQLIQIAANKNFSPDQLKKARNRFHATPAWEHILDKEGMQSLLLNLQGPKQDNLNTILKNKNLYKKMLDKQIGIRFIIPLFLSNTLKVSLNLLQLEAISTFNPNEVEENMLNLAMKLNQVLTII